MTSSNPRVMNSTAVLAVGLVWFLTLVGCNTYSDYGTFVREPRPIVTSTEYRVAPPNVIRITSKRVREINGHSEQIRPDGNLTLPLLGTFFVAGRTVEETSSEPEQFTAEYYGDVDINVRVTSFNSKKVFVFGEVGSPDPYEYDGANTTRLDNLLQELPQKYDHGIVDTPSVVELADAGIIGSMSDDVPSIVRMHEPNPQAARRKQAIRTLTSYNAPVVGLIATDQSRYRGPYYYKYGYHYGYQYTGKKAA